MAASDGPAHLLSLKVMRVSRPEIASAWQPFYSSSPSFSAHSSASILSLQGTNPLPGHPKTLRDLTHASDLLTLPSSFGAIQLGETFSSCLCINNETKVEIEVVQARVEMQTVTTKVVVHEMDGESKKLKGGDTLEHIVHHEIKELGQHVLACTVTYRLPTNARSVPGSSEDAADPSLQTFRKFYKFAVTNPLSVKTKVHSPKSPSALLSSSERDKIFLEVHIQNLTQDAIYFERMKLECTDGWEAEDCNTFSDEDGSMRSIFSGAMALMHPQDMRQYIYCLVPKNPQSNVPGSIIPLGRLDISWRSSFGEPGRLLTSMLSRRIPPTAPVTQPASAVPPHLKRTIASSVSTRPRSPSVAPSRSGTPPPGQRPSSPAQNRSSTGLNRPQSPQQAMLAPPPVLSDIDVQLLVSHIPRTQVAVEKTFSISFTILLSSIVVPGNAQLRRLKLVVQHIRPRSAPPLVISPLVEAFSPKLPSSGFSTPSSATFTFNYALAHQKILAASNRPLATEQEVQEAATISTDTTTLPQPYYDSLDESRTDSILFVGASALFLPEVIMNISEVANRTEGLSKVQATQDFTLHFIPLRRGFSTIGGIRIILLEDTLLDGIQEPDEKASGMKARILKEYEVIGEVLVTE